MKFKRTAKFMAMMAMVVAVVVLVVVPVKADDERFLKDYQVQPAGSDMVTIESYIKIGQHYAKSYTKLMSGSREYVSVSNTVIQYYDSYEHEYRHRSNLVSQDYIYADAYFYLPNTHTCCYIGSDHTACYTNFTTQIGTWHAE